MAQGQRTLGRLTAVAVRNAKPKRGRSAALLSDGANLYLQITGSGGTSPSVLDSQI